MFRPVAEVLGDKFFFVASPSQVYDALPESALKAEITKFLGPWKAKHGDRDPNWAARGWDGVMLTASGDRAGQVLRRPEGARPARDDHRLPGHDRRLQHVADRASGHHRQPVPARDDHQRPGQSRRSERCGSRAHPILEVKELSARYGSVEALHSASMSVADGEFIAILGPNGAGKSTLHARDHGPGRQFGHRALSRRDAAARGARCLRRARPRAGAGRARHLRADDGRRKSRARRLSAARRRPSSPAGASACSRCFRACRNACTRSPARCRAASSRCSRSAAR